MINHARTLLLNDKAAVSSGTLGEEYVSPAYAPVALPTYLNTARKILLGSAPDRVFLNFRIAELLSFIHATELSEFIYALDPRVTYWPNTESDFFRTKTSITAQQVSGASSSRIYIGGATLTPDNITGRAFTEYAIKILNSTTSTVTVDISIADKNINVVRDIEWQDITPTGGDGGVSFTGLSAPIKFPNSDMTFQVNVGNVNLTTIVFEDFVDIVDENGFSLNNFALEGTATTLPMTAPATTPTYAISAQQEVLAQWLVQMFAKPDSAISTSLPRLEFLGEPFYLELFGVGNSAQPYSTFKNIWFDHPSPAYRLAAITLAIIYRANELRTTANG
jgi:hypothetical protein